MAAGKGKRQKVELTDIQRRAYELRSDGLSWGKVAEEMGTSRLNASRAVKRAEEKLAQAGAMEDNREDLLPSLRDEAGPSEPTEEEFERARLFFQDMNMPVGMATAVVNRLKAARGLSIETQTMPTNEAKVARFENLLALLTEFVDPYILAQASAKDLISGISTLVNTIQLLKGEPTQIMGFREREDLDDLATAIQAELDRRMKVVNHEPHAAAGE